MAKPDELSVLAEATRYLFQTLLLVREADLSSPTPCPDWDLRGLLAHVRASLADVADVLAVPELASGCLRASGATAVADPIGALRAAIVDFLLASLQLPTAGRRCEFQGRTLPANIVVYVGAIEMVLHAWDIAQACRIDRPIPAEIAAAQKDPTPKKPWWKRVLS